MTTASPLSPRSPATQHAEGQAGQEPGERVEAGDHQDPREQPDDGGAASKPVSLAAITPRAHAADRQQPPQAAEHRAEVDAVDGEAGQERAVPGRSSAGPPAPVVGGVGAERRPGRGLVTAADAALGQLGPASRRVASVKETEDEPPEPRVRAPGRARVRSRRGRAPAARGGWRAAGESRSVVLLDRGTSGTSGGTSTGGGGGDRASGSPSASARPGLTARDGESGRTDSLETRCGSRGRSRGRRWCACRPTEAAPSGQDQKPSLPEESQVLVGELQRGAGSTSDLDAQAGRCSWALDRQRLLGAP